MGPFSFSSPESLRGWRRADYDPLCSVRESQPRPENQLLLTKGDNNYLDDVELYQGLDWLERTHIVGKVRGCVHPMTSPWSEAHSPIFTLHSFLPFVGYVTIAMVRLGSIFSPRVSRDSSWQNDFPQLKFVILGGLGLLALIQRE